MWRSVLLVRRRFVVRTLWGCADVAMRRQSRVSEGGGYARRGIPRGNQSL